MLGCCVIRLITTRDASFEQNPRADFVFSFFNHLMKLDLCSIYECHALPQLAIGETNESRRERKRFIGIMFQQKERLRRVVVQRVVNDFRILGRPL